ncbi:MAG: hypothetical protein ABSH05_20980 [Bryobacteraceae bacterium]|jgi:hypothetical protein
MKAIRWILLLVVLLAAALAAFWTLRSRGPVRLTTGYQAVLLSNGSVYYGKLEALGSSYPVLRDVFYVPVGVDPNTKQTSSVLIPRGKEWHGPDYMILNARYILLVEPVTRGSRVAERIAKAPK